MNYGTAAVKYIDAFFQSIQWEAVTSRTVVAQQIGPKP